MKNKIMKYTALFSMLSLSNISTASTAINNVPITKIEMINVSTPGREQLRVEVKTGMTNDPMVCDGGDYFVLDTDSQLFDELYSMILSAKLAQQNVNLKVSGTPPSRCVINEININ